MRDSHDPRLTVGLIGLGNMGTAFAERLLDAGYGLVVMQPDAREGGAPRSARRRGRADHAEDLAERVDVVLTSLADDDAFDDGRGRGSSPRRGPAPSSST